MEGCTLVYGSVSNKVFLSSELSSNSNSNGMYFIKIIDAGQYELGGHLSCTPKRRYKYISVNK